MELTEEKLAPALDKLHQFEALVRKWQKAVNLVSSKDVSVIWTRHILDSAQLFYLLPPSAETLVDFGSGGGFPGIVLAILNKELQGPLKNICLIESDNKKSIFLQEAVRVLDLDVEIINQRIEDVQPFSADIVTARGFAPVNKILNLAKPFLTDKTQFLLLKGEHVAEELKEVSGQGSIDLMPAQIGKSGYIVRIAEVNVNG